MSSAGLGEMIGTNFFFVGGKGAILGEKIKGTSILPVAPKSTKRCKYIGPKNFAFVQLGSNHFSSFSVIHGTGWEYERFYWTYKRVQKW